MKRLLLTALTVATFGTMATAADAAYASGTKASHGGWYTVEVYERDRGIADGQDEIAATAGHPVRYEAEALLDPRDQAIARDGKAYAYKFDGYAGAALNYGHR